uniref:Condensin-2 complex subunit D3 n=1 Tax=Anthurium amnicola TaxID=1678845 RepID=A0A1D1Y9J5_9ARAE
MDDDDGPLSRVLSELEAHALHGPGDPAAPFPEAALSELQALLDGDGGEFWGQLASSNLPPSALARSISAAMDSPVPQTSLLASRVYLSALLSTSAPIRTLFAPLPVLSLLRSLRRSLKPHPPGSESSPVAAASSLGANRHKDSRRRKGRADGKGASRRPRDGDSTDHRTSIEELLLQVLKLLESVLNKVHLDEIPDAMKSMVATVAGILTNPTVQHRRLPDFCFRVLYGVVSTPRHGDQMLSGVEVMQSLAPMLFLPMKSPTRTSTLGFVTSQLVPLAKGNDAMRAALVYFPRFLSMKAPEKSEPRASAVDAIVEIVRVMEPEDRVTFIEFVHKMTEGKPQFRLLAVDLTLSLLTTLPDPLGADDTDEIDDAECHNGWGFKCLQVLVRRCSDSLAGIRARALTNMAHAVGFLSGDEKNHTLLQNLIADRFDSFNNLLRKRCLDEKAAVRKAALLLITKSMLLIGQTVDEVILKTVGRACSDPLVSIRKAAVSALSEAYRKFQDSRVTMEWLHAVPRLIMDNETSIQEECENLFLELVLNRISSVGNANLVSDAPNLESVVPEGVLVLLKGTCDAEVVPCVKKICASLGKKKKLKHSIATSLQNIITISESIWINNLMPIEKWIAPPGVWLILSEVSSFVPKSIDWKFLRHHWELLDKGNSVDVTGGVDTMKPISVTWAGDRVSLLQTISNVSVELPPEPAAELAHNLLTRIEDFNMHLTEVDAHVKALNTLCKQKATTHHEGDSLVLKWAGQVSSKALRIVENYVAEVSEVKNNDSFLTPQSESRKQNKEVLKESLSQAVTAVFTIGSLVLVCPSIDLKGITPMLHTIITSPNLDLKPKNLSGMTVSVKERAPSLYIQSWVTMGKICLADDKLAKRYIPLFVQELERSDSAAIRNNIMIIMTDFCVRYTALVDCYIPKITNSLRDPCEVVRRQTFILLSRLLQSDYVKWKGVLFLRFLLTLVDDSDKIRHLADYLFGNILKVKAPLLAYNSFVEAIFVLNDCHAHAGHCENQSPSQNTSRVFSIRGNDEKSRTQRMHIYVSLLKQMAPEQLLATSAKLCAEILAAAADGLLNIDDATGQSVLQDALQILACKEMRRRPERSADAAEMEEEGGDGGAAAVQAAKGRAVTQASKKNLIQHAVPIFIELKRLLESKNSPLTGCLMECLRVLLKDYKNEIEDILVADKQLQKELIYDMHKYEAAKTKSKVAEAVANVQRPDGFRSARVVEKLGTGERVASAVADAAAKAAARSVLKEVSRDQPTPPLSAMSLPKVRSGATNGEAPSGDRRMDVLESLRKRQSFDSDDEN